MKETQREASADALPLHSAVLLETSHISLDDRFAAQNCLCGGSLPAYIPFTVVLPFLSFSVSRLEIDYRKSAMFEGGCVGSGGSVAATAFTFSHSTGMSFCRISQIVS